MRLIALLAAGMLAACEPTKPSSPPSAVEIPPEALANMRGVAERGPEADFKPMDPGQGDTEQARQQAEASWRELDRSAAVVGSDIAAMRRQADEAYRRAQPPSPEPAAPQPAPAPDPKPPEPAPATPAAGG